MARTKKPSLERKWLITAEGFNFVVSEEEYNKVKDLMDAMVVKDGSFITFKEDGPREGEISVRADKITRFSTALFDKEQ